MNLNANDFVTVIYYIDLYLPFLDVNKPEINL